MKKSMNRKEFLSLMGAGGACQANNRRFYSDGHGATFSETGAVTGGPAPRALKMYNTSLTANSLRVYS
jgi:cytochrome b6-f complex iron-sulfur subunit